MYISSAGKENADIVFQEFLKEELAKTQDNLQTSISASEKDINPITKLLQAKIQEKDEIISDKDHETFALKEKVQKNGRDLKAERAKVQEFKDELDVMRSERDSFAKKANTLEKYRQKIQSAQQDTDQLRKEIGQLRKENDAASDALKHHSDTIDEMRKENTKLQLENNEYRPALSRSEQHNHDLQKAKKRLEFDNTELAQRLHASEQREQALQRELGEDRRGFVADQPPNTTTEQTLLTELGTTEELRLASMLLTWTRLISLSRRDKLAIVEAEHRETQSIRDAHVSALQSMLDDANERQKTRNEKHLETYQEKLQLEASLNQIQQGASAEWSKSTSPEFRNVTHTSNSTESFEKRTAQLEAEKKKRAEIEGQLREAIRQLDTSQNDRMSLEDLFWMVVEQHTNHLSVALVDMDKLKMLEEVKKHNSAALTQLQKQHKILQGDYREMESDLDDHKVMLQNSTDARASKQGTASSEQELQNILEIVRAATAERPANSAGQEAIVQRFESLTDIITRDREGVAKAREVNKVILPEADYEFSSLRNPTAAQPSPRTSSNRPSSTNRLFSSIRPSSSNRPPSTSRPSSANRPPSSHASSWVGRFKAKDNANSNKT